MGNLRSELHPEAFAEAQAAYDWYFSHSPLAALGFLVALQHALAAIERAPLEHRPYLSGTRRVLLQRYPYLVVYRAFDDRILILAVAHGNRRPGYWRTRA